ncbi:hypothetical protein BC939DRAFT_298568 [Gamsiella multidivaricata]|uniref:uncharacterized protein n=1 Tax=Gamsiella multidivaricata TaxID=101098 RepID=UPI00221FAB67|nr:uncharacterized protein BC939DRAFT_298568 [Gamsiella multidivaricata]KAI7818231.1 hypothetical protein BC939DRAFT_298568 [Gamsiella multidivaricata]
MDIALRILRRLAYFPVKHRSLVDHHAIVHLPEFRSRFWALNKRSLSECKNPILQLNCNLEDKTHTLQNDSIVCEKYIASFSMLWQITIQPKSQAAVPKWKVEDPIFPSWIHIIGQAAWVLFNLGLKPVVKYHKFTPVLLEHPAIDPLVDFRWNTIGFYYWLFHFFLAVRLLPADFGSRIHAGVYTRPWFTRRCLYCSHHPGNYLPIS